ncbi:uncharacterized protein si:ch211-198p11.6 isoform X1 [Entelurus aequoreus]|uniref:uncharacterized protein si:ch211-198p11.6 isoform X1 n=1 Tax=Entelurus aequoreus TaxID=161455 RepID=UPI002B1D02E2|nr:uncharacterized protein si:ch211-198p11.6 isoform X1 [Entelurus aequoreus]XP_061906403.1 uncharacterized protein si:ch211-198p11.6 isoform X1 [Entelurus aequoreus]
MSVLPAWGLSIPLPAVIFIGVSIYMLVLALALWIRFCLKERYSLACDCGCPSWSVWEHCFNVAQSCDCRLPSLRSCLRDMCASPSVSGAHVVRRASCDVSSCFFHLSVAGGIARARVSLLSASPATAFASRSASNSNHNTEAKVICIVATRRRQSRQ